MTQLNYKPRFIRVRPVQPASIRVLFFRLLRITLSAGSPARGDSGSKRIPIPFLLFASLRETLLQWQTRSFSRRGSFRMTQGLGLCDSRHHR